MDANPEVLIFYCYRYSEEMGKAAEAVLKGTPTQEQLDHLYALVKRNGGRHLSPDVYMALIEAVRRGAESAQGTARDASSMVPNPKSED